MELFWVRWGDTNRNGLAKVWIYADRSADAAATAEALIPEPAGSWLGIADLRKTPPRYSHPGDLRMGLEVAGRFAGEIEVPVALDAALALSEGIGQVELLVLKPELGSPRFFIGESHEALAAYQQNFDEKWRAMQLEWLEMERRHAHFHMLDYPGKFADQMDRIPEVYPYYGRRMFVPCVFRIHGEDAIAVIVPGIGQVSEITGDTRQTNPGLFELIRNGHWGRILVDTSAEGRFTGDVHIV